MTDAPSTILKSAGPNRSKWDKIALLVAQEELSQREIAKEGRIARSTLQVWLDDPDFNALVGDYKGQIIAAALKLPIAKVHERVRILNDLLARNLRIIEDRAERHQANMANSPEAAMRAVFGDVTPPEAAHGMLVERPKIAANGKTVVEWAYDTALESAIRNELDLAAKELGQREETFNHNHSGMIREYVIVTETDAVLIPDPFRTPTP